MVIKSGCGMGPGRLAILVLFFLLLSAGCATGPRTIPLARDEESAVARTFLERLQQQEECYSCLDAQVTVRFDSLLQKGTVDGFLQLMPPSSLRFVGFNPLGQPLLFLATDGLHFRYVPVTERKVYEGNTTAKAFVKQAPGGFRPAQGFFWLTGHPASADLEVLKVARDAEREGYWLEIRYDDTDDRRRILFDLDQQEIVRQEALGEGGETGMAVYYADFLEVAAPPGASGRCFLPGRVEVNSGRANGGSLLIFLSDWAVGATCAAEDFTVTAPAGFERVPVK